MKTERALENRHQEDGRLFSPSAARNREPIADAFAAEEITKGRVLEIGSGSGEHAVEMLSRFPDLNWTASDIDPQARQSCVAWAAHLGLSDRLNVALVDVVANVWEIGEGQFDLIYCANVAHISPFELAENLFEKAPGLLTGGGHLVLYGPFRHEGVFTADSNAEFDRRLRERNPLWGVRDLEQDILPLANKAGLTLKNIRAMPANNEFVVFSF